MKKSLIILLVLMSCATDTNRAHLRATRYLQSKGYATKHLQQDTLIITVDSRDYIMGGSAGIYNPETKEIILLKNCPEYVAFHEWLHFFLDQIGVPCRFHHSIINGR